MIWKKLSRYWVAPWRAGNPLICVFVSEKGNINKQWQGNIIPFPLPRRRIFGGYTLYGGICWLHVGHIWLDILVIFGSFRCQTCWGCCYKKIMPQSIHWEWERIPPPKCTTWVCLKMGVSRKTTNVDRTDADQQQNLGTPISRQIHIGPSWGSESCDWHRNYLVGFSWGCDSYLLR